jgi:3',5'-cyclic AMP phosphodiesterase CpdA
VLQGIAALAGAVALPKGIAARPADPPGPVRFAVIGDWGHGNAAEAAIADRMFEKHEQKPLDFVLTVGDNIYPDGSLSRVAETFERPFARLIAAGVPFYAALGNHDLPATADQVAYAPFHMNGQRYYKLAAGNGTLDVFVLDSNVMDPAQLAWLDRELGDSTATWKVATFHHPLYSSGREHGSSTVLRFFLEPILRRHGVDVVFSGHDHIYERVVPQHGIQYFVTGGGGDVRIGDIDRSDPLLAAGYDSDNHFMLVDVASTFRFRAINARGERVDKGHLAAAAAARAR